MQKFKIVDLFSGAGGMSSGFLQTNKFEVVMATEKNRNMQQTYKLNHPDVIVTDDVKKNDYNAIMEKYGHIDVVIGGPPCQGFSNANRQRNYLINSNNQLVKEFIRAVIQLRPKAFVMENVKMLASDKHKFFCTNNDFDDIANKSIVCNDLDLIIEIPDEFLDCIVYYFDEKTSFREYIVDKTVYNSLRILANCLNNDKLYEEKKKKKSVDLIKSIRRIVEWVDSKVDDEIVSRMRKIAYKFEYNYENNDSEFRKYLQIFNRLQIALSKLYEIELYDLYIKSYSVVGNKVGITVVSYTVVDYIKSVISEYYNYDDGVLNAVNFGVPQSRERYIMVGKRKDLSGESEIILPNGNNIKTTVYDAISDLEHIQPSKSISINYIATQKDRVESSKLDEIKDSSKIYNHIITDSSELALTRFSKLSQGQNFHDLEDEDKQTYTSPNKTQNSIYRRLRYDEPSPTVTNVRKSMWIHPSLNRAISIREAARLQSFPDSYIFCGTKDFQYQQVGNAVPPKLGKSIAEYIYSLIQ